MTLVEADPIVAPDEPADEHDALDAIAALDGSPAALPDDLLAPGAVDVAVEQDDPRCRSCGSPLVAGEQWCLSCGAAVSAPRRLPGLRAMLVAGSLALVLAGGAVAASVAAIQQETPAQEVKVETVAKLTPAPPVVEDTTPEPVDFDDTAPLSDADIDPVTPVEPVTPVTPVTPTATTPTTTTTTPATTEKKPAEPGTTPILAGLTAGSLYDPSKRATASGEPSRALDGDPNTSWFATTSPGGDMNVGFLVDLEDPASVLRLRLVTKTPGFSLQVFGAKGEKAPEAADSEGWTRLGEAGSVDGDAPEGSAPSSPPADGDKAGDGELKLKLDPGDERYRWIMLWVTTPPAAGTTVRFNEIRLYT